MHTRFTELVGCEVPIQLAPMGTISTPELVAAVTGAGGMGMTSMPMATPEAVVEMLDRIAAAAHGPFGFNMLIPFIDVDVVDVAAPRCGLVDFYHGDPDPALVDRVHGHHALAGWQVGSVADARAAADARCDLLVVRGTEGGGRMHGSRSLWPLLVEVLDAVDVPVLAAGGGGLPRDAAWRARSPPAPPACAWARASWRRPSRARTPRTRTPSWPRRAPIRSSPTPIA